MSIVSLVAVVDIMCEFIEVVLHQFFYFTGYYKHVYFERRTKYGVIAYMNRVPEVLLYVKNLIQSIQPWMMRKEFQAMRLSIVTIEGTELVSLLLKHTNNVLCQEETIDYQRVCTDNGGKI
ncbi:hypothetical protein JH06_4505 [Blastocystis sp. subtype 4]|uniref:hypothetical protein n=1 Tax=Blastocystis sp. subtype 4 TaxID=944170 RepID=UPI0007119D40|nr:hypothetical protein JH06_4505 [Blastocystis sp. subtype 4]KNB41936.1 hypothetical protein JH06_4505 [Blastocystis sp. subtype 4]|eukprot:XP_014525379.1 hypothetical protein JH06_4505 [Blastocystis sp. subtype 4]